MKIIQLIIFSCLTLASISGCKDNQPIKAWQHDAQGMYLAKFADNADLVIAAAKNGVTLWNTKSGKNLHTWHHDQNAEQVDNWQVSLAADGSTALTAKDSSIVIWDITSGNASGYWKLPGIINAAQLSTTGQYAILGLNSGTTVVLNTAVGQSIRVFEHDAAANSVALSQDMHYALVGYDDENAILWDITNDRQQHIWRHTTPVQQVIISPKNNFAMTTAHAKPIKIWNTATGKLHQELATGSNNIVSAQFSADDKLLVTGVLPSSIKLWDLQTGASLHDWDLPRKNVWQPSDDTVLATKINTAKNLIMVETSSGLGYVWKITTNN